MPQRTFLGPSGTTLWRALQALKSEGIIGGIGISAYVADDPVVLAEHFRPDAMQLPFSLLDQRLLQDGSLERLKQLGVEIHARSLFLQGLLFMPEPPENLGAAGRCWKGAGTDCACRHHAALQPRLALCSRGRKSMLPWSA